MSRQTQPKLTAGKVPNLDDTVARASREPFVSGLDSNRTYPAQVTRDDTRQLPVWVVRRLDSAYCLVQL
jgi:hypothetical protein